MACGTGGCSTGGCGSSSASSGCNKLNTFNWLEEMQLPPNMKPFNIVEVRFKGTRKEYFKNVYNIDAYVNELVVVETENGQDIGKISLKGELVKLQLKKNGKTEDDNDFKKILRLANEADIARYKENQELEIPTMYKARSVAMELGLSMKLSDVEYQGDRRKATFYYTADDRVDFRELIKRLAEMFKVRIEMRQIGYRQEAGRLGGIGSCGRELCCSTWLTDFSVVHISAARYQNLSINQLKLSGQCGKLKCCLNFELDQYVEALKEFPNTENLVLNFADNISYKAVKTDILKQIIWFVPVNIIGGEWVSFNVAQANEFIAKNKNGEKPVFENAIKKVVKVEKVELDFKNDMGKDSVTRLDDKDRAKRNKSRNKKNKPIAKNAETSTPQVAANQPNKANKPNKNRNRNKNRNNNNKPDNTTPNNPTK